MSQDTSFSCFDFCVIEEDDYALNENYQVWYYL